MAYVQKTRTEEVAAALQELRWEEMRNIGFYLSQVEQDGTEGPDFWCSILADWSSEIISDYKQRCEAKD